MPGLSAFHRRNTRDVKGGAIEFMTIYEHKSFVEAVLTLAGENMQTQKPLQVNTVILCQDNDKAGEIQAGEFVKKLRELDVMVSPAIPKGKDFNDDLVAMHRAEQQRGGHPSAQAGDQATENQPPQSERNNDFIIME